MAFGQIPFFGPLILVVGIISFAYSTILGWAYYGERCVEYFAGKAGLLPYRLLYVAVLLVAPVLALDLVWKVADILERIDGDTEPDRSAAPFSGYRKRDEKIY